MAEEDDDWDWKEFHDWMKQRHRDHVARNMQDYQKYLLQMEFLGFTEQPMGAGHRFTHPSGHRIDFWRQSGKWTIVGTNVYQQGPKKMIRYAKLYVEEQNSAPVALPENMRDQTPQTRNPQATPGLKYSEPRDDDTPPWEE